MADEEIAKPKPLIEVTTRTITRWIVTVDGEDHDAFDSIEGARAEADRLLAESEAEGVE